MRLKFLALVSSLFVAILLAGPSFAASFDRSKAESPLEHAICAKPDLSTADDTLARAYATAMGGLSSDAGQKLRASQNAWLSFAARDCTTDGLPAHEAFTDDETECLVELFHDREHLLERSRMIGGLRFTFADRDEARLDSPPKDDSSPPRSVASAHSSYPQIDGTDDEASRFNAVASSSLRKDDANEPPDGKDTAEDLEVSLVNATRITLTDTESVFNHGAAHGYDQIIYVHYLRDEHRVLTAADMFSKAGWQDRLRKRVLSALKVSVGSDLIIDDPESRAALRDESVSPSHWDFRDQGLLVQFGQGDVAAPDEGTASVIIPWALVQDDLNPGIGRSIRDGD